MYNVLLIFTVMSGVCQSFIPNKTTFIKYRLTQWISKLPRSFEIHGVKQYLVNYTRLTGIVTVYTIEPSFTGLGHGKLS